MSDLPSTSDRSPLSELSDSAEALAELAATLGHREIAEAIRDDARRRLDDGRVRVVVLGEIKHGKSSLINALLQDSLLPTGVTPTTGAVVAVRVDPEQRGQTGTYLASSSGAHAPVDAARFAELARGKAVDEAGRTPELLVDDAILPATLELIDTPGFNDLARFRAALSRSELPRADVLVLVLDATQVLSRSELGLIRDAIAAVGGLEDSGARCLLVINRIDLVPEDERARIVEHIQSELASVIPGPLTPFLTDAKAALKQGFEASEAAAAVGRLRDELFGLAGRGREILPARARAALLRHARLLGYNAAVQARALALARDELAAEVGRVEAAMAEQARDLSELRARVGQASETIVTASCERVDRFRAELEQAARAQIDEADIQTLTQVVPGAIQDAFLAFVNHEREHLRAELEQLTRDLMTTCGELARRRLAHATLALGYRGPGLYVEPPNVLVEIGTVALGIVGTVIWYFGNTMTGMVMTIASPLATVILREKTVRDARTQACAALPTALDDATAQLRETVGVAVERHAEALDDHLMLADRALTTQLLEGLRSAEARLASHEARLPPLAGANADADTPAERPNSDADAPADASDEPDADPPSASDADEQPDELDAERQRRSERVSAAALAEFARLEARLAELEATLEALVLDTDPEPQDDPNQPPVLH